MNWWKFPHRSHRRADATAQGRRRAGGLVAALMTAWDRAEVAEVGALLHRHVTLTVDSGAASEFASVVGPPAVASALVDLRGWFDGSTLSLGEVNARPGIVIRSGDRVVGIVAVAQQRTKIAALWAILNADKLSHWNRA